MRAGWLHTSAIPVSALARWPSVLVCVRINIILYYVNVFTYYYNNIIGVYTTSRNSRTLATEIAEEGAHIGIYIHICAVHLVVL